MPRTRRIRAFSSTGTIAACSISSPTPRGSTAASSSSAGSLRATLLAEHGSPLVVYDEATLRASARAYRAAAPDAFVCYGTKAFPNVAILALLAEEGIGADVSTLGEIRFAQAAGIPGDRLVMHGNNKSDDELRTAADAGALVVVDSLEEIDRARAAGVARSLVRVTPGHRGRHAREDPHRPPRLEVRPAARRRARGAPPHAGDRGPARPSRLAAPRRRRRADGRRLDGGFAARARDETGWELRTIDLGGGLGVPTAPDEPQLSIEPFVRALLAALERAFALHGLARPQVILEPGRSLVARAGVTLYTVGSVKRASAATTWVAVDGGMSDNPRPALYGARYTALLANRADEAPTGAYAVAGKHCESGDLLIERVELPEPRRGDILAVPATGGYTLAMSSTYNAVPRPAVVLVSDGEARVIRRRETIDDLLALEA